MANGDSYITLNVGGICYTTSRLTLTSFPDSMLGTMFSEGGVPPQPDKNGHYFIDRDGTMFRCILNFLRDKKLNLPSSFEEYDQLLAEADFFMLPDLKHKISLRLNPKPVSPNKKEVVLVKNLNSNTSPGHVCLVEATSETWSKLSLTSAIFKAIPDNRVQSSGLQTDARMLHRFYDGQHLLSILGYIVQDGFKLEGRSLFGRYESLVLTAYL